MDSTLDDFIWQRNRIGPELKLIDIERNINYVQKMEVTKEMRMLNQAWKREMIADDLKLHADDTDVTVGDYQW